MQTANTECAFFQFPLSVVVVSSIMLEEEEVTWSTLIFPYIAESNANSVSSSAVCIAFQGANNRYAHMGTYVDIADKINAVRVRSPEC